MPDDNTPSTAPEEIIARPGIERRLRVGGVAALLLGCAVWFGYDGFIRYPEQNRIADSRHVPRDHNAASLALQRGVAFTLPIASIALLAWMLHASRGQYRLAGDVLHVPGQPPINLTQLTNLRIDKRRWQKKGIARIEYELSDGTNGEFVLDDMYYQREPTDRILDRLEAIVKADQPA